jgi:hypothetical protein
MNGISKKAGVDQALSWTEPQGIISDLAGDALFPLEAGILLVMQAPETLLDQFLAIPQQEDLHPLMDMGTEIIMKP